MRAFQPTEPARRRAARADLLALLGFLGLAILVPVARAAMANGMRPMIPSALFTVEALLCPITGLAAWLVWRRIDIGLARKRAALRSWGWLLMLSALWTSALQSLGNPAFGLGLLLVCLVVAVRTTLAFRPIRPAAAILLIPYASWLCIISAVVIVRF